VHKNEEGEDLVSPEDQLKRLSEHVVALVDHARPRDSGARHAVHHLASLIDQYITGELQPARAKAFERLIQAVPATSES
jgi:hypothetical protein